MHFRTTHTQVLRTASSAANPEALWVSCGNRPPTGCQLVPGLRVTWYQDTQSDRSKNILFIIHLSLTVFLSFFFFSRNIYNDIQLASRPVVFKWGVSPGGDRGPQKVKKLRKINKLIYNNNNCLFVKGVFGPKQMLFEVP